MVDQTFLLFIQIFVFGAFAVFMAFGLGTLVLMIHLTSMPERRRAPRPEAQPSASFAD
jgi:uncharacterized membrane protein YccF (DUF307 family)